MKRQLVAQLAVGGLIAAAIVFGVQSSSSADTWHWSANGEVGIHEELYSQPNSSIIHARFWNTDSAGNYVATQLIATDLNNEVIAQLPKPGAGQYAWVPGNGGIMDVTSNFAPFSTHLGTCHIYATRVLFQSGTVIWSPKVKYCNSDVS